jgi:hypothetical protein
LPGPALAVTQIRAARGNAGAIKRGNSAIQADWLWTLSECVYAVEIMAIPGNIVRASGASQCASE